MTQARGRQTFIRFGVFEADLRTGELRKKGHLVRLQEQPFQVLALLLARPGEMVTREEFHQQLWPADTFVDFEHGLNKAISKLRSTLDDDSGTPRYIETLPRRGYRFIAPIAGALPPSEPSEDQATAVSQPEPAASSSPQRGRWKSLITFSILGLLTLLVSLAGYKLVRKQPHRVPATLSASIHSLAVLPLQNLSGEKDQEYFADGMTDELITDLGQMSALRVISRTSVMHYKQSRETLRQIGRELTADAIVEGSVFRSGNRVRITAQLIDARNDRHLWARTYERDLRDVIAMQDEVARDIANEIQVKLTPQQQARLTSSRAVNPQAHEAYLKGRYYWDQFTMEDLKKSFPLFQEAIAKDPNYALGYSGLADYYVVSYVRFDLSRNEACPKAEPFALKSVELNNAIAEAHYSLASVRYFCNWDIKGAESELKRALQLNPSFSEAHRVYAELLASEGKFREAEAEAERAVENDPMSGDINMVLGWIYLLDGRYSQAIRQERKTIEIDPKRPNTYLVLGIVYLKEKQYDLAIRECTKAAQLWRVDPGAFPWVGYAYGLAGRRRRALEVLKRLNATSATQPLSAFGIAIVYIGLRNKQQAFAWLEKAYEQHDWILTSVNADPVFDSLRSDPRFQDLVHRIGL
ncbi:MAG TPA: tetratricopeptide repeat protein [Terriglobia bacterium]|nr:tetratricopeptide repeat protein [Terriglobia bacterium]